MQTLIVRSAAQPRSRIWLLACTFPNLTIGTGGGSSGIAWYDTSDHTRLFPAELWTGGLNFAAKINPGSLSVDQDHLGSAQLDIYAVDPAGADLPSGSPTPLATTRYTVGPADIFPRFGYYTESGSGSLRNAAGLRLQFTCTNMLNFALTIPDPCYVAIHG